LHGCRGKSGNLKKAPAALAREHLPQLVLLPYPVLAVAFRAIHKSIRHHNHLGLLAANERFISSVTHITIWDILSQVEQMKKTGSIANLVRLYLRRRPILFSMLRDGLCNYSSLAQKVSRSVGAGGKTYAVKAALIRAAREQGSSTEHYESRVEKLLRSSSIEVRSKVAVVRSRSAIGVPVIAVSNSRSGVMSVVDSSYVPKLKKKGHNVTDGLMLITVYSPREIEDTPGSIASMIDALWAEGINILEFISCDTDTLLVLRSSEGTRAFEVLSEMMEPKKK